jgi:hypothetical protein
VRKIHIRYVNRTSKESDPNKRNTIQIWCVRMEERYLHLHFKIMIYYNLICSNIEFENTYQENPFNCSKYKSKGFRNDDSHVIQFPFLEYILIPLINLTMNRVLGNEIYESLGLYIQK